MPSKAELEKRITAAVKHLENVEMCGCWDEPPGEGLDPEHKASIEAALFNLRTE